MRVAGLGLGLIAFISLVACGSDPRPALGGAAPEEPTQAKDPNLPSDLIVPGLKVKDVAVFQAVKVPVVENGDTYTGKQTAPVVAGRQGIIRVYVSSDSSFKSGKVTAELRLVGPDGTTFPTIRETKTISGESTEEDADSTFNLEFPGSSFPEGVSFQVWLTSPTGEQTAETAETDGRYPHDGTLWQDLGAVPSGKLRVVVVPIKYTADGSNRLPTTTDEQIELYRKTLMARYPASEVEVTLHAPYTYDAEISGTDGQSFSDILTAMRTLRSKDNPDDDVYYFGSMMPTKSFQTFCSGGCIAGLSTVADEVAASPLRSSVGVGYPGQQAADTLAHEVGHAHGREHAPCGNPAGVDPKFPYKDANLGSWGYDMFAKEFLSPKTSHDMMAYCPNEWVSDYTYKALFKRIAALTKLATDKAADAQIIGTPKTEGYSIATVDGAGNAKWERDQSFRSILAGGRPTNATVLDAKGARLGVTTARFFPYDHAPGGVLFVPKGANPDWKAIQLEGSLKPLTR